MMKSQWYNLTKVVSTERLLEGHKYDSKHLNTLWLERHSQSDLIHNDLTIKKKRKEKRPRRSSQTTQESHGAI